jgi:hypothetical protein
MTKSELKSATLEELNKENQRAKMLLSDPAWYSRVPGEVIRKHRKIERDTENELLRRYGS